MVVHSAQESRLGRCSETGGRAMGRSPCCVKEGLKKGPWTPEEDQKLLAYIEQHGHGCWRSLPAKAGELASILQHSATVIFVSLVTDVHAKNGRGRAAAVRQELPAPVDELPPAGHQAGQVQPAGGADHHPAPRAARQQVSAPSICFAGWGIVLVALCTQNFDW